MSVFYLYVFIVIYLSVTVSVSLSLSLYSQSYLHFSNAVYYYSLPLLRSDLLSVHLQLDRQHRSIGVGHVL